MHMFQPSFYISQCRMAVRTLL